MSKNLGCACDRALIRLFVNSGQKPGVINIPDCYVTTKQGDHKFGSFSYRVQIPGECNQCYDRYMTSKVNRQFSPEDGVTLVWPPSKPKKPTNRWVFSKKDGWHILKRPAADTADVHLTICRTGIDPIGAAFSDDAPVYTKEIACGHCRKRVED